MSAPAASPSSNSPVPPVVSTPPAPDVVATPPAAVSLPPVPVVSSPPPVSPSPPPPSLAPPPPEVASSPPPVVPSSPPPPVVLPPLTSPPPPSTSTPSAPPPSTSTPSPPPPSTSTPSPPAPAVPSPPPPVQDTPSPPPPVDASPPTDSTTPAPPNDAVSPSPSRKQRSPPPPSRKLGAPPPAENDSVPPSPPLSAPPSNSPPGSPVALSPPPLSPGGNTTTPSGNPGTPTVPSPPSPLVPSPGTNGVLLSPPVTSITTDTSSSSVSSSAIVGIAIGGIAVLALLALVLVCFARKKNRSGNNYDHSQDIRTATSFYNKDDSYYDPGRGRFDSGFSTASDATGRPFFPPRPPSLGHSPTQGASNGSNFSYEVLAQATNGFSQVNMLGEGGFGCVYKGILPGGQEVAVKQLKVGGGQGEREFRAEVEIITRIHHRHLVTLVGYCISDTQRLLVYEYVPNGTLDYHLHGKGKNKALLDWSLRVKIAIGAARGLAYLHEDCHPKIIHRDIKSSNILLDNNFEAQVSDFGLAKLANDAHTHVSTRVMGTFGYLAPEYASTGKLTDKSDIYSFGVVLLELVTGRKPVDTSQPLGEESLVEWARPLLTQALETRNVDLLADPSLINYDNDEMLKMVGAAATCIRHSASKRPKLSRIVRSLENDSGTGFTDFHDSPFASEDYDNAQYSSDLRRFRKMALGTSQEYGSEYSGATSDYGVNPSVSSGEFPSKDWTSKPGRESELPLRSRQM